MTHAVTVKTPTCLAKTVVEIDSLRQIKSVAEVDEPAPPAKREDFRAYLATVWFPVRLLATPYWKPYGSAH